MWFNQNTHYKTRPKLLTFVLSMLLALSMVIPTITTNTLQVQAGVTSNENGGKPEANLGGQGGDTNKVEITTPGQSVSHTRTGWLVYVVDIKGNIQSNVTFVAGGTAKPDKTYNNQYLYSRLGHRAPSRFLTGAPWGTVVGEGDSYVALKQYVEAHGVVQQIK